MLTAKKSIRNAYIIFLFGCCYSFYHGIFGLNFLFFFRNSSVTLHSFFPTCRKYINCFLHSVKKLIHDTFYSKNTFGVGNRVLSLLLLPPLFSINWSPQFGVICKFDLSKSYSLCPI